MKTVNFLIAALITIVSLSSLSYAEAEFGALKVVASRDTAKIFIDGVFEGTGTVLKGNIIKGSHLVQVKDDGNNVLFEKMVDVGAGAQTNVVAKVGEEAQKSGETIPLGAEQPQESKKIPMNFGLRGGAGIDISGGIAYGLGGNTHLDTPGGITEIGLHFFGANSSRNSSSGVLTYNSTTNTYVFGLLANYLLNYVPDEPGLFFVGGVGIAGVSVTWTETSPNDTSLGTPWGAAGSMQTVAAGGVGSVVNLGMGYLFDGGLDLRFEAPMIFLFSTAGSAASFIPTFTLTAGYQM